MFKSTTAFFINITMKVLPTDKHIIEHMLQEKLNSAMDLFFDDVKNYFESLDYVFERKQGATSFKINTIPFILSEDQSSIIFHSEEMSDEMYLAFKNIDKNFDGDSFDLLEGIHFFIQKIPIYASKKLNNMRKTGVFENINKNMKRLIRFENFKMNEGSYEDFMTNYGQEIRKAAIQLKEIEKFQELASEETMDSVASEIDNVLSKYDKNLDRFIFGHFHDHVREISDFAIRNMNQFGTEPQMVLFAIEDVHNLLTRKNLITSHKYNENHSTEINFIASVDDDQIDNVKKIAEKLKNMGCTIKNVFSFGVIAGSTSSSIEELKIQGIKTVELDKKVKAL